ncbi:hypothetical protein ABZV75_14500 [Streptomyces flaveolus]|uniref:hypothetical protein n=1 Tax=Streptomyces flaveolus TaxID=67297 RepID=UPI0033A81E8D
MLDFPLPEGTTATSVPDTCRTAWTPGDDPAIGHYACTLPMWAEPDPKVGFPFRLRLDRVVPDATGRVGARPDSGTSFAFDPNGRNNAARGGRQPVRLTRGRGRSTGPARARRFPARVRPDGLCRCSPRPRVPRQPVRAAVRAGAPVARRVPGRDGA